MDAARYNLSIEQITTAVEAAGNLRASWRNGRCIVTNASGKRPVGTIWRNRDGSYSDDLSGLFGHDARQRLVAASVASVTATPAAADPHAVADAIRAGNARVRHTDAEIQAAVDAGHASVSDAMNQDF